MSNIDGEKEDKLTPWAAIATVSMLFQCVTGFYMHKDCCDQTSWRVYLYIYNGCNDRELKNNIGKRAIQLKGKLTHMQFGDVLIRRTSVYTLI